MVWTCCCAGDRDAFQSRSLCTTWSGSCAAKSKAAIATHVSGVSDVAHRQSRNISLQAFKFGQHFLRRVPFSASWGAALPVEFILHTKRQEELQTGKSGNNIGRESKQPLQPSATRTPFFGSRRAHGCVAQDVCRSSPFQSFPCSRVHLLSAAHPTEEFAAFRSSPRPKVCFVREFEPLMHARYHAYGTMHPCVRIGQCAIVCID